MTDIDYCNGRNCKIKDICQRYSDFIFRLELKQDVKYALNGIESEPCIQFRIKLFYGN